MEEEKTVKSRACTFAILERPQGRFAFGEVKRATTVLCTLSNLGRQCDSSNEAGLAGGRLSWLLDILSYHSGSTFVYTMSACVPSVPITHSSVSTYLSISWVPNVRTRAPLSKYVNLPRWSTGTPLRNCMYYVLCTPVNPVNWGPTLDKPPCQAYPPPAQAHYHTTEKHGTGRRFSSLHPISSWML